MRVKYPYLTDSNFLNIVDRQRIRQHYVKITVLDWDENPIQNIQGKITAGNITIDGSSSLRRTASLTFVAEDSDNVLDVENLISINKKIYMQIGFINTTNLYTDYKIIYFPLGYYVIINPSISQNQSGVLISLQLKDKMCLLNGQCGGTLPAATVFDNYETVDENGAQVIERPTIYQIIRQLVKNNQEKLLFLIQILELNKLCSGLVLLHYILYKKVHNINLQLAQNIIKNCQMTDGLIFQDLLLNTGEMLVIYIQILLFQEI